MQKTQLRTSQLGTTGLEITRVGFGVDGAITGFRRPGQVDPVLAAAGLELTDEDMNEIDATE
jgi:aryl-alcohol dehydrogenase-like predicted oxidoreductase